MAASMSVASVLNLVAIIVLCCVQPHLFQENTQANINTQQYITPGTADFKAESLDVQTSPEADDSSSVISEHGEQNETPENLQYEGNENLNEKSDKYNEVPEKDVNSEHGEQNETPENLQYEGNENLNEKSDKYNEIPEKETSKFNTEKNFYSFTAVDITGALVPLSDYEGQVALVVNVASECGFTDGHYRALIRLQNILSTNEKFTVLAFPCNQFGAQEPGSNEDIARFTSETYHINFPLFSKINVLDDNVPEAWQYLIAESGKAPNWNFWKYLVNHEGKVLNAWGPWTPVEDIFHEVKEAVDKASVETTGKWPNHGGEL